MSLFLPGIQLICIATKPYQLVAAAAIWIFPNLRSEGNHTYTRIAFRYSSCLLIIGVNHLDKSVFTLYPQICTDLRFQFFHPNNAPSLDESI